MFSFLSVCPSVNKTKKFERKYFQLYFAVQFAPVSLYKQARSLCQKLFIDSYQIMFITILFGIIFLILAFIYFKLIHPQKQLYDLFRSQGIPGEPFIPLFGQVFDMIRSNRENRGVDHFYELGEKHGLRYLFGFGPLTRLVILDADLLSDVLGRTNSENYRKPTDLVNIVKPILGVHNLLVSEGDEHERARRMLNPAFHFINLKSMVSIMSDQTMKSIKNIFKDNQNSVQIDLDQDMSILTFAIISSCAFGQSLENISNAQELLCQSFNEAKEITAYRTLRLVNQIKFLSELPFWGKKRIDEIAQNLSHFVDQAINDRRQGKSQSLCSGEDILDLLLNAVDEKGKGFTDQQIKDESLTFIMAGHETTGNLMSWIFYILMTREDVYRACLEEVEQILPDHRVPEYEDLAKLPIIEAVINETLRLYPSAPFFVREALKDHRIGENDKEIFVPRGAMIVIYSYAVHRRKEYWTNPLEFQYQRWLRDPTTGLKPKLSHPYAYLPFASGSRNCIGQNFALLEAKVMLIMFLQHCQFELVSGQIITPEMKGVTMRTKNGLLTRVKRRHL